MALTKYSIGELIEQTTETNADLRYGEGDVRGMTISKQIIPTKANISGTDLAKFLVVHPDEFVYNPRTHGKKIGFGYNDTEDSFLISWNNTAFRVKQEMRDIVLPEYLFLHFNREEWDREACYRSWGSSTEVFSWDALCEMELQLPPLHIQQKYVDVYTAMLANLRANMSGLEDLNTLISVSIEKFKHTAPRVTMGALLEEVDVRNRNGAITHVQGVNINKAFMPSVANLSATDLTKYKVIQKNQFAANFMHVMRDERIPFALYSDDEPSIISPAYQVFKVKSENVLEEFIMLWINRCESDRYAWFISDSSIRGGLELPRFFEIGIPLPSIEQQQAVVNFYNARHLILRNIATLENVIKDLCPILIKGSLTEVSARREDNS